MSFYFGLSFPLPLHYTEYPYATQEITTTPNIPSGVENCQNLGDETHTHTYTCLLGPLSHSLSIPPTHNIRVSLHPRSLHSTLLFIYLRLSPSLNFKKGKTDRSMLGSQTRAWHPETLLGTKHFTSSPLHHQGEG